MLQSCRWEVGGPGHPLPSTHSRSRTPGQAQKRGQRVPLLAMALKPEGRCCPRVGRADRLGPGVRRRESVLPRVSSLKAQDVSWAGWARSAACPSLPGLPLHYVAALGARVHMCLRPLPHCLCLQPGPSQGHWRLAAAQPCTRHTGQLPLCPHSAVLCGPLGSPWHLPGPSG